MYTINDNAEVDWLMAHQSIDNLKQIGNRQSVHRWRRRFRQITTAVDERAASRPSARDVALVLP